MRRLRVIFGILLGLALAAEAIPQDALAQSSGNIVVAQNNSGPGGFFRRLFGGNRRTAAATAAARALQAVSRFRCAGAAGATASASVRRAPPRRSRAKQPPVEKAADAKRALVIGDFMANALAKGLTDAYRENRQYRRG